MNDETRPATSVGIFWFVSDATGATLVGDATPLIEAARYGDCLTHPTGHYERWESWRCAGPGWLKRNGLPIVICRSEYDAHPRGRIVFEIPADRFVIYADRRVQGRASIDRIIKRFGLIEQRYVVRSDSHYR